MKKLFIVLAMLVIGASPAYASRANNKDKPETPSTHLKLDICHNNHIIPVSVHAADKIDTGHGLFDPVTHTFTARVDVPGHEGDTVARAYLKAGNEEVNIYTNPESSCTGEKAPESNNKVFIHVCVDSTLMLFEGTDINKLKADVDAFVAAHVRDHNIKVGTDCVPITTTTTVKSTSLPDSDLVGPDASVPNSPTAVTQPLTQLPRTGGSGALAVVGVVLIALGISLMVLGNHIRRHV